MRKTAEVKGTNCGINFQRRYIKEADLFKNNTLNKISSE